jgi:predicted nicotinamide N-methyase
MAPRVPNGLQRIFTEQCVKSDLRPRIVVQKNYEARGSGLGNANFFMKDPRQYSLLSVLKLGRRAGLGLIVVAFTLLGYVCPSIK